VDFYPDIGIKEMAVGGGWQALGQEEESTHQVLDLPLVASDKLREVRSGVVDSLGLVLYALLRQVDELQPVQFKLQRWMLKICYFQYVKSFSPFLELPALLGFLYAALPILEQVLSCAALGSLKSGSVLEMALYYRRQSLDLLPTSQKIQ
jgi:hypothetical protein